MLRPLILAVPLALALLPMASVAQAQQAEAQVVTPGGVLSEAAPELAAVFETMGLYDILHIMSNEGIEASLQLENDMFPGQGGAAWAGVVNGIYASDRLISDFEAAIPLALFTPDIMAALTTYAGTDLAERIATGEVAARRAFLEPGVEDVANGIVAEARANDDRRIGLLTDFIEANDFIERNVSGALNSNFAFYRGLSENGAFEQEMPEQLMLAEVWGQEAELRVDMTEWLYAYQITAYSDLSDDDLRAYIAFSQTPAGEVLNAALFQAFDVMFERVSYELGAAAAVFIAGEET